MHVDRKGSLYVTEVSNDRSQMFRPVADADPATRLAPQAVVRERPQ